MKKKLLAVVVAVLLLIGIMPMTAFAEAGAWDPLTSLSSVAGKYAGAGLNTSKNVTVVIGAGDIPMSCMPILTSGNTSWNAMAYCGVTAASSNEAVAVVKENGISIGKWSGGVWNNADCLQVLVEPKALGTATVTVNFYYTFSQSANPLTNANAQWFSGTMKYYISVVEEVEKPNKPTTNDVQKFHNQVNATSTSEGAVYLWCDEDLYNHGAWFDYMTDVDGGYSLGEVVANDGSVLSATQYPWVCPMTVYSYKWLEEYNSQLAATCGTHYLRKDEPLTQTIMWYYDIEANKWKYRASNAPVYIDITCDRSKAQQYTVTYTDGVADEVVFEDQVYSNLVYNDDTPAFVGTPTRTNYVFAGWTPEVSAKVTGTVIYTATWEEDINGNGIPDKVEDRYTVTYTDGVVDEEVFKDQVYGNLLSGVDTPAFVGTPTRTNYVFAGWTPEVSAKVTGTVTYTATWEEDINGNGTADKDEDKYTVTYTDGVAEEEVFEDQVYGNLLSGVDTPAFVGTPKRDGYTFIGWAPEVTDKVTESVTYVAQWSNIPETGDSSDIALWAVILLASGLAMAAAKMQKRSRQK